MSGINIYNIERILLSSLYTNAKNEKEIYNSSNQLLCFACLVNTVKSWNTTKVQVISR